MIIVRFQFSPDFSVNCVHHYVRSIIKTANNVIQKVGPSIEPRGTPDSTDNSEDVEPFITTDCSLPLR